MRIWIPNPRPAGQCYLHTKLQCGTTQESIFKTVQRLTSLNDGQIYEESWVTITCSKIHVGTIKMKYVYIP